MFPSPRRAGVLFEASGKVGASGRVDPNGSVAAWLPSDLRGLTSQGVVEINRRGRGEGARKPAFPGLTLRAGVPIGVSAFLGSGLGPAHHFLPPLLGPT